MEHSNDGNTLFTTLRKKVSSARVEQVERGSIKLDNVELLNLSGHPSG
jgi:hypothetical protein